MHRYLHIVSPDIPYPVDYGGVVDIFCKLKILHEAGILIHFHCYEYGRTRQTELNRYCKTVTYYRRQLGLAAISFRRPYIVNSRKNHELLGNLLKDDYPILLEGIHTSWPVFDHRFNHRTIILRLHNVEYIYYRELARTSSPPLKRIYYFLESKMLRRYEKRVARRAKIIAVSKEDEAIFRDEFGSTDISTIPVFLPWSTVTSKEGKGDFCLYHGNLSVAENEKAVLWLMKHVFDILKTPFVIAGKSPSKSIIHACSKSSFTCLIVDPSEQEMQDLIMRAHIHVLPSFNHTGIKLKLLNAIFNGRHCLVNDAATMGTSLGSGCHIANDAAGFREKIKEVFQLSFTAKDIQLRNDLTVKLYDNVGNAKKLIQSIW